MKQKKRIELLAPAGNREAFMGAIHAGADAVYLGGSRFGARAYADNFTEEELISCIRYAHLFGRRVYLTVNTLIKEAEFPELLEYLLPYYTEGLDGVIVQDIGAMRVIREHFPGLELHISTQMTVTGAYGAALLKDMGACRVVPARELQLEEIKYLKETTGMEVEAFIHGAMCYCYSGQCLFSSILGGRSGNRGRCAQPCRLPYRVEDAGAVTGECYPLSLKDMCTIEHIPELIEAGIDSFKIEGRMKKPEYAAGVTAIYRKYIDKYLQNPSDKFEVSKEDISRLSALYIRSERQDGYYYKHNGREMVTLHKPSYSGSDEALLAEIRSRYLDRSPKLPIVVYAEFLTDEEAKLTLILEDLSVTVTGQTVQPAQKQPVTRENIEKQLSKLGDSVFEAEYMEITLSEQIFYPLKAMNDLRREAVSRLEEQLIRKYRLPYKREAVQIKKMQEQRSQECREERGNAPKKNNNAMIVSVTSHEQLQQVIKQGKECKIAKIYINSDLILKSEFSMAELAEMPDTEVVLALPHILRRGDTEYLEKLYELALKEQDRISGFLVRCMEGLGFLLARKYIGAIYTDAGFYIWNQSTLQEWEQHISAFCLPYELKSSELRQVLAGSDLPCEKIFYGRIPMMITANCVARTTGECRKGRAQGIQLIDRYRKKFPVYLNCVHCMNIIYNSVPLSLHGDISKWQGQVGIRLDFTVEDKEETKKVLEFFQEVLSEVSGKRKPPYEEYTTGHEKRGVE